MLTEQIIHWRTSVHTSDRCRTGILMVPTLIWSFEYVVNQGRSNQGFSQKQQILHRIFPFSFSVLTLIAEWWASPRVLAQGNITQTIHHSMSADSQQRGNRTWAYTIFAQIVNTSKPGYYQDSMNQWLKKCHARPGSTRGKGSGFQQMVWIRTNVHGMKISCNLRNREPIVDFDEWVWETQLLNFTLFSKQMQGMEFVPGNKGNILCAIVLRMHEIIVNLWPRQSVEWCNGEGSQSF